MSRVELVQVGDGMTVTVDGSSAGVLTVSQCGWWSGDLEIKVPQANGDTFICQVADAADIHEARGQVIEFIWADFEDL